MAHGDFSNLGINQWNEPKLGNDRVDIF